MLVSSAHRANVSRYARFAAYVLVATVIVGFSFFQIDVSNRTVLNFLLCLVLGLMLIFIGIASMREEREGMELGGYDARQPTEVGEVGELDDLAAEFELVEPHWAVRRPRQARSLMR